MGDNNICPGLGQAQKCGRVKPVYVDSNHLLLITKSPTEYTSKQTIKNRQRFAELFMSNLTYIRL